MLNFKIAERVCMKKLTIALFFTCISTLVVASDNYFQPVQLPDRAKVLEILMRQGVDQNVADPVATNIANQKTSEHKVYQALHEAGGFGKQEIYIPLYGRAAKEIVERARSL